jgi:hypothetical protein
MGTESLSIDISDEIFAISIDGAMSSQDISDKISSVTDGNWKRITFMEYNNITGQIRIKYEE